MKKFFILFILVSGIFFPSNSAGGILDEEEKLEKLFLRADDTLKAYELYNTGFALRAENPLLAFECAKRLLNCARNISSSRYIAKSYNLFGILYYRKHDYENALYFHREALKLREQLKDESECAASYTNLGNIYSDLQDFRLSEKYHLSALSVFSKQGNEKQVMNCLCNLGVLKHGEKKDDAAIENLSKALSIAEKLNDYEARAMCCNNLGFVCEESEKYNEALSYYYETVKLQEMMDAETQLADAYYSIGTVYALMDENPKAIEWLNKSLVSARKHLYVEAEKLALEKLAEIYKAEGNFEKASSIVKEIQLIVVDDAESVNAGGRTFSFPSAKQAAAEEIVPDNRILYSVIAALSAALLYAAFFNPFKKMNHEQEEQKQA